MRKDDLFAEPSRLSFDTLCLLCTLAAMSGAVVGAVSFVVYGLIFEQFVMPQLRVPGEPMRSYGQLFGLIMLPLGMLLGASAGVSLALARWRNCLTGAAFNVAIPFLVSFTALQLWRSSLAEYGPNPSDWVMFVPLLLASALSLTWTLLLFAAGCLEKLFRRRPCSMVIRITQP